MAYKKFEKEQVVVLDEFEATVYIRHRIVGPKFLEGSTDFEELLVEGIQDNIVLPVSSEMYDQWYLEPLKSRQLLSDKLEECLEARSLRLYFVPLRREDDIYLLEDVFDSAMVKDRRFVLWHS